MFSLSALNPIAFNLLGLEIHWYGLIIAFGALVGVLMALSEAKKRGIDPENILDLVLYGVPIALIGARSTMLFLNYHFI
jgi:Prolipoprotein diacylglyceryltransferase